MSLLQHVKKIETKTSKRQGNFRFSDKTQQHETGEVRTEGFSTGDEKRYFASL